MELKQTGLAAGDRCCGSPLGRLAGRGRRLSAKHVLLRATGRSRVIRRMTFEHPIFTRDSLAAQTRHAEVSGPQRVHFCGAYWRNGFHEDGVVSGLAVARTLAARPEPALA